MDRGSVFDSEGNEKPTAMEIGLVGKAPRRKGATSSVNALPAPPRPYKGKGKGKGEGKFEKKQEMN
eukprot:3545125-Heterocapsa_arctica.AAC.1